MKPFGEIVGRVEEVRRTFGLPKSHFSARIGMKPQTYNNFVGAQGSRPNIALIHGVVRAFGVNPMWLLNGVEPRFLDGTDTAVANPATVAGFPRLVAADSGATAPSLASAGPALHLELDRILASFDQGRTPLLEREWLLEPGVEHALSVLTHYFVTHPVATSAGMARTLDAFRDLLAQYQRAGLQKPVGNPGA